MAKLRADFDFIRAVDRAFPQRASITTEAMVSRFLPKCLQGHRRAMRFLADSGLIEPLDAPGTEFLLAARRVLVRSADSDPDWVHQALAEYWEWLKSTAATYRERGHKRVMFPLTALSVGQVLRAARAMLRYAHGAGVRESRAIQQSLVDHVLVKDVTSAGNLARFIDFLNQCTKRFYKLRAPPPRLPSKAGPYLSDAEFKSRIRMLLGSQNPVDIQWRTCALVCLLYAQQPRRMIAFPLERMRIASQRISLKFKEGWMDIDPKLAPFLRAWLKERERLLATGTLRGETFLFPSQYANRPQRVDSLSHWLRSRGIALNTLFPSALANLFRHGPDDVGSSLAILGVSPSMVQRYGAAFAMPQRRQLRHALQKAGVDSRAP